MFREAIPQLSPWAERVEPGIKWWCPYLILFIQSRHICMSGAHANVPLHSCVLALIQCFTIVRAVHSQYTSPWEMLKNRAINCLKELADACLLLGRSIDSCQVSEIKQRSLTEHWRLRPDILFPLLLLDLCVSRKKWVRIRDPGSEQDRRVCYIKKNLIRFIQRHYHML